MYRQFLLPLCFIGVSSSYRFSMTQTFQLIQSDCGQVCDTSVEPVRKGKYYDVIEKHFECDDLFQSEFLEGWQLERSNSDDLPVLMRLWDLKESAREYYGYQGKVHVRDLFFDGLREKRRKASKNEEPDIVWTAEKVNNLRALFRNQKLVGTYGVEPTNEIASGMRDHMLNWISGGHVLVIGSETPWIEAMLLELGAANVTTLDYNQVISEVPNIRILSPSGMRQLWTESGGQVNFDAVVTFSSVEHSGLGAYGDALNPWGDLIASAQAWCLTRPGGRMLMGVPVGYDQVFFNGGRQYGPLQMAHLFANWEQVYADIEVTQNGTFIEWPKWRQNYQPVHIVQKANMRSEL